jgi:hypothetical protein
MENLKIKKVIYKRKSGLSRLNDALRIFWIKKLKSETLTGRILINTGGQINTVVYDLIYKTKQGVFKTVKTGLEINDQVPTEFLYSDENNKPIMDIVFQNGTGEYNFLKFDVTKLNFIPQDIRVNDVFENVARRLLMLFNLDKEKKLFYTLIVAGLVAMGLFIAFGLTGLGNVISAGIKVVMENAIKSVITTNPVVIPTAP